jgi:hypothetical protein
MPRPAPHDDNSDDDSDDDEIALAKKVSKLGYGNNFPEEAGTQLGTSSANANSL